MFTTVMFDLDGTLSDSFPGVSHGIEYALKRLGYEIPSAEVLKAFMGPPLHDSFSRFCKMNDETAAEAVRIYREYYPEKGIFEQSLNEGAEKTLETLSSMGISVCLATSKPQTFSEKILKNFNIEKYFNVIVGATMDGAISKKEQVVALVLEKTGASPEECLMVGDRFYDVEGAHACGVKCAAVICGYGSLKEFDSCGADYIINGLPDVIRIVKNPDDHSFFA